MRLMNLMLRLYIILMPRSLCVCVRLGVTFTFIFIIEVLLKAKNNNKSEKIALYHINLAIIIRNEK